MATMMASLIFWLGIPILSTAFHFISCVIIPPLLIAFDRRTVSKCHQDFAKSPAEALNSILAPTTPRKGKCIICHDRYARPVKTPCGHIFCDICIRTALSQRDSCPYCQRALFKPKKQTSKQEQTAGGAGQALNDVEDRMVVAAGWLLASLLLGLFLLTVISLCSGGSRGRGLEGSIKLALVATVYAYAFAYVEITILVAELHHWQGTGLKWSLFMMSVSAVVWSVNQRWTDSMGKVMVLFSWVPVRAVFVGAGFQYLAMWARQRMRRER